MKKITIYLPDWLYDRITKLNLGNDSAAIRTLLIFSAKDFETFLKDEGLESEDDIEEEPSNTKAMQLMTQFFEEMSRLEAVREGQNFSFPGVPADYEPAMNRLGTVGAGETRFLNIPEKTPQPRDPTWDMDGTGGIQ